jgi:hypothetical protein
MRFPYDSYLKEEALWYCVTRKKHYPNNESDEVTERNEQPGSSMVEKERTNEPKEASAYKEAIREKLGPLLTVGLWFFIDWKYVYPDSHEFGYWVFVAWVLFQVIEQTWLFFTRRRFGIWVGIVCIGGIVGYRFIPATPPMETAFHGWLMPANDPVPENACSSVPYFKPSKDSLTILLGDAAAVTTDWQSRKGKPLTIMTLGKCRDLLAINKTPDGLTIDANVYGTDRHLAVRIEQNEFHIVQQEVAYPVRQGRSGLAVYDLDGKELLWIRYLNPLAVSIRGIFTCPSGGRISFASTGLTAPHVGGIINACMGGPVGSAQSEFVFGP